MAKSLSEDYFLHWQDKFHSQFWNGRAYDFRTTLAKVLSDQSYLDSGAVFCTIAGSQQPSTAQRIELGDLAIVDTDKQGLFAAVKDKFVVIQNNRVYNFPYDHCQDFEIGWIRQKLLARIKFYNQGTLFVWVNTWKPRNIIQRFFSNESLAKQVMGKYSVLQPAFKDLVGSDVNPRVVEMYEEFSRTLASFITYIIKMR